MVNITIWLTPRSDYVFVYGGHIHQQHVIDTTGLEKIYSFLSLKSSIKDYFRLPKINNVHR